jgi:hypothetical protein
MIDSPNVTSIGARSPWPTSAVEQRCAAATIAEQAPSPGTIGQDRQPAAIQRRQAHHGRQAEVGGDDEQVAVGDVDDAHDAEG